MSWKDSAGTEAPTFEGNTRDRDTGASYGSRGGASSGSAAGASRSGGASSAGGNTVNLTSTNANRYADGTGNTAGGSGGSDRGSAARVNAGQPGYNENRAYQAAGYNYVDPYVANGSFAADGSRGALWTDAYNLSDEDQAKIQAIRSNAALTGEQKNQQANAIRTAHGYTIDQKGNVVWTDASAGTGVYRGTRAGDNLFGTGKDDPAGTGGAAGTPGAGGAGTRYAGAGGYANYLADLQGYPGGPELSYNGGAPRLTYSPSAPELSYEGSAPELSYQANAPQLSYEGSAPELSYNGSAPELQYSGQAPELVHQQRQARTRDLSDLEKAAEGAGGDKLSHLDESPFRGYLDQWLQAAQQQAENRADYAVQQGVNELQRNEEDAAEQFRSQRNAIDIDEAKARNNQALYAAARGDRGGVAAAQYDAVANAANQNRQTVRTAQTKLATDTARQIADLRAQGEFQKADQLLSVSQNYLSELMSLSKWAAEYNLGVDQFNAQLNQWLASYRADLAQLDIQQGQWAQGFDFQQAQYGNQLAQQNYQNRLADEQYRNQLLQQNYQNRLTDEQYRNELQQQNYQNRLADAQYQNQLENTNWQNQFQEAQYGNQLRQQNYQNQMADAQYRNQLANANFQNRFQEAQYGNQLQQQNFQNGLTAEQYRNQLAQQNWENEMNRAQNQNALQLQLQNREDSREDAAWTRAAQEAQMASAAQEADWNRNLQMMKFGADRADTAWQQGFTQQQYADSLEQQAFENQQAKDKQLAGYGQAMLNAGIMPSQSVLSAMGLSEGDAKLWANMALQMQALSAKSGSSGGRRSSGGGGGGGSDSSKSGKPSFTEASVRENIKNGNLSPGVLDAYKYYNGASYYKTNQDKLGEYARQMLGAVRNEMRENGTKTLTVQQKNALRTSVTNGMMTDGELDGILDILGIE